ncbi:polysaccharide ABC transporter ATP-binding protein [Cognataquiflexum rubidum]|uniref:ABC transporter ATP-binding protein n=1 Tax=Cognataquiflexum rubidum TaxID=2922273 RepID=UPI001F129B4A|nr:ABC transporter ATP-binding protein [Cognataquiflexum rubidum]MCH6236509.1 ABC transporter ATP-binding protein [Cognataquiflexum rubidum]
MEKSEEVLIRVEGVSKRFCKSLKRSLAYGMMDITKSVLGIPLSKQLRKQEFWAVKDVSFELRRGECMGIIGHNGAGKSTLLKMINGLIKPDEGRIELKGKIGALIELGAGFSPVLTGRENIYNNGAVLGFSKAEIDKKLNEIIAFSELEEFIDMPVQNYSSGMKVRLGFAIAAQLEPDVLILDEVLAVGDATFRMKCFNRISEMLKNTAVIFVSHSMAQVARICDRVILLKKGEMISAKSSNLAITDYLSSIKLSIDTRSQESSMISILKGYLADESGNELRDIVSGQTFQCVIHFDVKNFQELDRARFMAVFVDYELNSAIQVDQDLAFDSNGIFELKLNFEDLCLKSGKFYINTVILNGARGEFIAAKDNLINFTCTHKKDGYAPVFVNPIASWSKSIEVGN